MEMHMEGLVPNTAPRKLLRPFALRCGPCPKYSNCGLATQHPGPCFTAATLSHTASNSGLCRRCWHRIKNRALRNPRAVAPHPHHGPRGSSESKGNPTCAEKKGPRNVHADGGCAEQCALAQECVIKAPPLLPSNPSSGSAQEKWKPRCVGARSSIVCERPKRKGCPEWRSGLSAVGREDTPGPWKERALVHGHHAGLKTNLLSEKRPQRLTEQCHGYKN